LRLSGIDATVEILRGRNETRADVVVFEIYDGSSAVGVVRW
jgi:hypothetical protein